MTRFIMPDDCRIDVNILIPQPFIEIATNVAKDPTKLFKRLSLLTTRWCDRKFVPIVYRNGANAEVYVAPVLLLAQKRVNPYWKNSKKILTFSLLLY